MRRLVLLTALLVLFAASANAYLVPFDSSGWVDPNFNDSWNPLTLTGIARYYFFFDNPLVRVNELALQFEGDIFDLAQLDASDFNMIVPAGWNTIMWPEGPTLKWAISGGGYINTTQDPIILDVNYVLLTANRYSFGDNTYAGDPNPWGWNEAQGANSPWSQKYILSGKILIGDQIWWDAASGGSTAPIPEPGSLILLGTGLLGIIGYGKVRLAKKV